MMGRLQCGDARLQFLGRPNRLDPLDDEPRHVRCQQPCGHSIQHGGHLLTDRGIGILGEAHLLHLRLDAGHDLAEHDGSGVGFALQRLADQHGDDVVHFIEHLLGGEQSLVGDSLTAAGSGAFIAIQADDALFRRPASSLDACATVQRHPLALAALSPAASSGAPAAMSCAIAISSASRDPACR